MIEPVREGAFLPAFFATNPTPFRLGLDGKAMSAPSANYRGSGSRAPWNGTTDKRTYGFDGEPPPPPPPTTPQSDGLTRYEGVTEVYKMAPEGGFNPAPRGRLPKSDDSSIVPPPRGTTPPPINTPPPIPTPSVDPGDVGHDTDDNIDDLTDLFRETFTGTPSGGGVGGGGASILPTTIAASDGGGSSGGGGLVTVLVLLAIGAAAWFGYKAWKKRKAAQS